MENSLPGHFRLPINSTNISSSFRNNVKGLDAYTRHKKFMNDYALYYSHGKKPQRNETINTEYDILKKEYKFIRTEEDNDNSTWEKRIAKKYYDKLYKEYCLANLKFYKEGKIALRWRIEDELISGKGQFICGNVDCFETENLHSWEVNFAYKEDNQKKNALVKLKLCPKCSYKLNYKKIKQIKKEEREERKRKKKQKNKKHERSKKRKRNDSDSEEDSNKEEINDNEDGEQSTLKSTKEKYIEKLLEEQEKEKKKLEERESPEKEENENFERKASEIWKASLPKEESVEKSKEEEYDDYFADLFT